MGYHVAILADSINPAGVRAVTAEMRYQKYVHPQFMATRKFSRNAASNRARPLRATLRDVWRDPAGPRVWKYRGKQMQPGGEMGPIPAAICSFLWYGSRYPMMLVALLLAWLNVSKEVGNRILEPWCWITVIVTSTDWNNFRRQRLAHDTQDDFGHVVRMLFDAMDASTPKRLAAGEWHLPFISDRDRAEYPTPVGPYPDSMDATSWSHALVEISAGRSARVSWLNHHRQRKPTEDIRLCFTLVTDLHMSPLEHQLMALETDERVGNVRGFRQFRKFIPNEEGEEIEMGEAA